MKRKKGLIIVFVACMFGLLLGCSTPTKDEHEILQDFADYKEDLTFIQFNEIVIDKRQTNKESKTDTVYATISGDGDYATHKYGCILYYNYYEQGGWILDNVTMENLEVSNITVKSNEEIISMIKENSYCIYGSGSTYDNMDLEVASVSDPMADKQEYIYNLGEENSDFDSSIIPFFVQLEFDIAHTGELNYNVSGTCFIQENYDFNTGQWVYYDDGYNIEKQNIENLENIVWRGTPNTYGYYHIGKLVKQDDFTYSWWEKSFSDEDEELVFDDEADFRAEDGCLEVHVITNIDLIADTNRYAGYYYYHDLEKEFVDEESEHSLIIDFESGTLQFSRYEIIYSIISTTGESFGGSSISSDPLDGRKRDDGFDSVD